MACEKLEVGMKVKLTFKWPDSRHMHHGTFGDIIAVSADGKAAQVKFQHRVRGGTKIWKELWISHLNLLVAQHQPGKAPQYEAIEKPATAFDPEVYEMRLRALAGRVAKLEQKLLDVGMALA